MDTAKLKVVSRVIPTAVVGTIHSFGYNDTTEVFDMSSTFSCKNEQTTSGTVFMRLSFMFSDSIFDMVSSSPGMSSKPFRLMFSAVRSVSCEAHAA